MMSLKGLQDILQESALDLNIHQHHDAHTHTYIHSHASSSSLVLLNGYPLTVTLTVKDTPDTKTEEQLLVWKQIAAHLSVSFKFLQAGKSVSFSCRHHEDMDLLIEVEEREGTSPIHIHIHTTIHIHSLVCGDQGADNLTMDLVLGLKDTVKDTLNDSSSSSVSFSGALKSLLHHAYLGSPLSFERILSLSDVSFKPLFSVSVRADVMPRATVVTVFVHTPLAPHSS
ncbi:hypothetical protein EON64_18585, partial [archaeon]